MNAALPEIRRVATGRFQNNNMNIKLETLALGPVIDVDLLDTAKPLTEIFQPYQTTLVKWEAKAKSLIVTDISQKTEMAQARLARLELRDARCELERTRKNLVEGLKERAGKIDSAARFVRVNIEALEETLRASEEFAERYVAAAKAELKAKRESELLPLIDAPLLGDLSDLSETDYAKTMENARLLRQAKIDAAAKAEADRIAKEAADKAERERMAVENARLKAEAVELARVAEIERKARAEQTAREQAERIAAESKARQEQAERDAKARKDREVIQAKFELERKAARAESDRLQAELAAKLQVEIAEKARAEAERKAQEKEAKRLAAAPDAAKLRAWADIVRGLELPMLSNSTLLSQVDAHRKALAVWVESQAEQETLL